MAKSANKKKKVKVDSVGEAHIHSSFNNIIISLTNLTGQVISGQVQEKWDSVDLRKNTPYAAQCAAEDCGKEAMDYGLKKVRVFVKDLELVVKAQSVPFITWESKLQKSLM